MLFQDQANRINDGTECLLENAARASRRKSDPVTCGELSRTVLPTT